LLQSTQDPTTTTIKSTLQSANPFAFYLPLQNIQTLKEQYAEPRDDRAAYLSNRHPI
jgi:hypothetical protein